MPSAENVAVVNLYILRTFLLSVRTLCGHVSLGLRHPRVHLQAAELELFLQMYIWQVVRMTDITDIFVLF